MASNPKTIYTQDEYLALERNCETKHEYYDGEIFAMGGASRYHVTVVTNLVGELHTQLKEGPCHVYSADLRVKVALRRNLAGYELSVGWWNAFN